MPVTGTWMRHVPVRIDGLAVSRGGTGGRFQIAVPVRVRTGSQRLEDRGRPREGDRPSPAPRLLITGTVGFGWSVLLSVAIDARVEFRGAGFVAIVGTVRIDPRCSDSRRVRLPLTAAVTARELAGIQQGRDHAVPLPFAAELMSGRGPNDPHRGAGRVCQLRGWGRLRPERQGGRASRAVPRESIGRFVDRQVANNRSGEGCRNDPPEPVPRYLGCRQPMR